LIKFYLPRRKFRFNQNTDVLDDQGHLLYVLKSSVFLGRLTLYKNDKIIYTSESKISFRRRHDIKRHDETICSIKSKHLFFVIKYLIETNLGSFHYEGSPFAEKFQIIQNNQVVLSIDNDPNKVYRKIIEVDELKTEFLLMLMFTLMYAADIDASGS
jgi:uncharacterized protein YxjI